MQIETEFSNLQKSLGHKITNGGKQYLYFGGTAYLGIPQNERFLKLYLEGIKKFGLNNGTSRNNNVQLSIYNEAEKYAAKKYNAADALITSSGFLAAQIAVQSLSKFGEIRYAPATHPALWINDPPKTTGNFVSWSKKIVDEINSSSKKTWIIISNSMNNLYPEIYDFEFLKDIGLSKEIILIIDDSHGIGINNNGLSALSIIPQSENVKTIVVASMAKALGVDAGIIIGNADLIGELKQTNAFFGASPPAAAGLFAFMNAAHIYQHELEKLNANILLLSNWLKGNTDWHFIPNFPVYFSKNTDISEILFKQQILVSAFPYPDKDGAMVSRIVLSSWHEESDITKLINSLN
jgi:8-amino-7-oxononanoate synthase